MLRIEKDLRQFVKDWTKYAEQDNNAAKTQSDYGTHGSYMAGKASAEQECARALLLWLDDGGR